METTAGGVQTPHCNTLQNTKFQNKTFYLTKGNKGIDDSYVNVLVNGGGPHQLLLDTGARGTCMDQAFAVRNGFRFENLRPKDNTSFVAAGGHNMIVERMATVSVNLGAINMDIRFHVIPRLGTDMILSRKDQIENELSIMCDGYVDIHHGMDKVPLRKFGEIPLLARLQQTITIPAFSQAIVPIVLRGRFQDSVLLIEPIDNSNPRDFRVARTLLKTKGIKRCPVWNDSDEPLTLPQNTPIATISTITDIVDMVEADHERGVILGETNIPKPKYTFEDLKIKLENPDLSDEQIEQFKQLINQFGDVFALENSELEGTDVLEYEIQVKADTRPVRQTPYHYSEKAREEIRRQLKELLDIKFIRPSVSPWAANCLLVKKANGTMRLCVDYRMLNRSIIPEIHSVPSYTCIADTIGARKPTIFSSLDLRSGFHNLKVAEHSIKYTGFQTFMGQFEYLRAPYGIQNIPAHMQRVMNLILSQGNGPLMKYALAYLDDLLIFSSSPEQHCEHLREIFTRLRSSKLKLNSGKCHFLLPKLIFLGNLVSADGIGPNPEKVSAMLKYPVPTNQKKLKCLLGLYQFYKKFMPHYSQLVAPLNRLLAHDVEFVWTEVEQKCFETLQEALKNAPFMTYPSDTDLYILQTDASTRATGYILNQRDSEGNERIIACGGRALHKPETRYTITELELLSIVEAVTKYRHYLLGKEFIIQSDHRSLKYIQGLKDSGSGRIYRWSVLLTPYRYTVEHISGKQNVVADALSRRSYDEVPNSELDEI